MARSFSTAVTRRWAPEGKTATRTTTQRGLRSLAFADRLMVPYVTRAAAPRTSAAVRTRYAGKPLPQTNWLFPVPWYRDELEWLVAARSATAQAYAAPQTEASAPGVNLQLEYIAPAMASTTGQAAPARSRTPGRAALVGPVRAWSPLVDFPAAQAAEVMAGVVAGAAARAPAPSLPMAPVMEFLSPAQVSSTRARQQAAVWAPPSTPVIRPQVSEQVRKELQQAARALTETPPPASDSVEQAPIAEAPPVAPAPAAHRAAALLAHTMANEGAAFTPAAGPRVALPVGLGGLVNGLAARDVVMSPVVERPRPTAAPAQSIAAAVPDATPAPRLRRPAVAMPVLSGPHYAGAYEAIASTQPGALTHVAWADRWLARFSGASTESLTRVSEGVLPTISAARAPSAIFLAPPDHAVPTQPDDVLAPEQAPSPRAAPVIEDGAAVPDSVFERLARAAAGLEPMPAPTPTSATVESAAASESTPSPRTRAPAPTVADRILATPPVISGAGLAPALASSPIAPALAGVLDLPIAPVFDVRSVTAPAIARWYATPAPTPIERPSILAASPGASLASRAPTFDWLVPSLAPRAQERAVSSPVAPRRAMESQPLLELLTLPQVPAAQLVTAPQQVPAAEPSVESASEASMVADAPRATPMLGSVPFTPAVTASAIEAARPQLRSSQEIASRYAARPGQTAQLAQSWSVEQERSSSDLSFDFVPPELVMAARVYGFTPVQAAQAARLAAVGPAGLQALASAVDLTFVQQLATADQARSTTEWDHPSLAGTSPRTAPETPVVALPTSGPELGFQATSELFAAPTSTASAVLGAPPRQPRGATLMPEATAGALQLSSAGVERQLPHARAALDLLAASVVADASVFPVLFAPDVGGAKEESPVAPQLAPLIDADQPLAFQPPQEIPDVADTPDAARAIARQISSSSARPMPPQFESIYVALSQSAAGRSMSPAVRAARALALAHRSAPASPALERTTAALALVVPDGGSSWDATSRGAPAPSSRSAASKPASPDMPAIELMASGAGESLRSLVAPLVHHIAEGSSLRATAYTPPTADQPLVHAPGERPVLGARAGGGDVEIPSWFESAARKMFEQAPSGDQISIAEMILVNTAPAKQVAASPAGSAQSSSGGGGGGGGGAPGGGKVSEHELEHLADEVYELVMQMMETALMRQGGH